MLERTRHYRTAGKEDLTPRQREVLQLVADGRTNPEIAERLGITLDGAKFHIREILAKLDVESREEAAEWWRAQRGVRSKVAAWLRAISPAGLLKPVALGGAVGGTTLGVVAAGFAMNGGGGGDDAATLPACEVTDIQAAARDLGPADRGRTYSLELWAGEPCLLSGAGWVRVVRPNPSRASVTSAPSEDVYLELDSQPREVALATWANWCDDFEPGAFVQFDIWRAQDRAAGVQATLVASVPVSEAPPCDDPGRAPELIIGFESDDPIPPTCNPNDLSWSAEFALDPAVGLRLTWSAESAVACLLHDTVTIVLSAPGVGGLLSPPDIEGVPADIAIQHILGVGVNPLVVGTLSNVCDASQLVMGLQSGQQASYLLDVPVPPCLDARLPGRFSAAWTATLSSRLFEVTPLALPQAAEYTTYTIKAGDRLMLIAMTHGVSVARILLANPGLDSDNLRIGEEIRIPRSPTPTP